MFLLQFKFTHFQSIQIKFMWRPDAGKSMIVEGVVNQIGEEQRTLDCGIEKNAIRPPESKYRNLVSFRHIDCVGARVLFKESGKNFTLMKWARSIGKNLMWGDATDLARRFNTLWMCCSKWHQDSTDLASVHSTIWYLDGRRNYLCLLVNNFLDCVCRIDIDRLMDIGETIISDIHHCFQHVIIMRITCFMLKFLRKKSSSSSISLTTNLIPLCEAPKKALVVSWRLVLDRLTTWENLSKRGMIPSLHHTCCAFFFVDLETAQHLFLLIPISFRI